MLIESAPLIRLLIRLGIKSAHPKYMQTVMEEIYQTLGKQAYQTVPEYIVMNPVDYATLIEHIRKAGYEGK
jgi:hypothetical protein